MMSDQFLRTIKAFTTGFINPDYPLAVRTLCKIILHGLKKNLIRKYSDINLKLWVLELYK